MKPLFSGRHRLNQHREDLPLNNCDEVHIPADAMSIAYRRGLVKQFGLGGVLVR